VPYLPDCQLIFIHADDIVAHSSPLLIPPELRYGGADPQFRSSARQSCKVETNKLLKMLLRLQGIATSMTMMASFARHFSPISALPSQIEIR
jgi:hypothetical protein